MNIKSPWNHHLVQQIVVSDWYWEVSPSNFAMNKILDKSITFQTADINSPPSWQVGYSPYIQTIFRRGSVEVYNPLILTSNGTSTA